MLSWIVVFVVFSILILILDAGHLIAAKRAGIKVEAFSLGMGKRLIGKKIGETDYRVSIIPFGGFCQMAGENPHLEALNEFEKEVRENKKVSVQTIVRNEADIKLRRLREKQMMDEEAQKRSEDRFRLRDQGMAHCFDKDLLKRFIITMNQSKSFDLSGLL